MADAAIVQLPDHPDRERLEAEATDLLEEGSCASLPDARQRVAARYGFPDWPKLADYVGSIGVMGELERAIQADDADRVRQLLRDDPSLIHREEHWIKRRRHNGYRPLAYAAFFVRTGVMKALIDAGADVHEGEEKALRAAACFDRNLPAVDLLLGHGAHPDASTTSPSGVPYRVIEYPCMTLAPAMLDRLASAGGRLLPENTGMILATNERRPGDKAACLRKPTPEGGEYTWRDVTAAEYARRFVYPDLVNQDALRRVTEAGG